MIEQEVEDLGHLIARILREEGVPPVPAVQMSHRLLAAMSEYFNA